jgi:hypothetical protein
MKVRVKNSVSPVDSKIVREDYIVEQGSTISYSFLDARENPLGKSLSVPIMFIWKVHRNHPVRMRTQDSGWVRVWPINDRRMPAEVVEDKLAHDVATYVLLPFYDPNLEATLGRTRSIPFANSFYPANSSEPGTASVFYINHGGDVHSQDDIATASIVPAGLVANHLWNFLINRGRVYSHEKTFNRKYEGRVEISPQQIRDSKLLDTILGERFHITI